MDEPRKPAKRPTVLNKLNTESLHFIERGLLGDLPDKLKPNYLPPVPVRGRPNELAVAKPHSFLSACLPVIPDSPVSPPSEKVTSSDDEAPSPLRKSFSFRQKFSRISFLKKHKDTEKDSKTDVKDGIRSPTSEHAEEKSDHNYKSNKRFWLFRNKEVMDKKGHKPIYQRSKSFEFLPRALEEVPEEHNRKSKKRVSNTHSFQFDNNNSMGEAWTSNESLEYISNVYYDNDDTVFLKSIKEISPDSSKQSSLSTVNTSSSGIVMDIFHRESMQNLVDEFHKTVDLFSENYLSDCEPYTRTSKDDVQERRKSLSFSTLPSPKVLQMAKVSEVSEDFKNELSKLISEKRASVPLDPKSCRRGSVTDWFVLEDRKAAATAAAGTDANKYRRAQKKPMNRVRRMSSTKYWITPEECAVYSREQRPPLVIPRITQYRTPRREPRATPKNSFSEESPSQDSGSTKSSLLQYDRLQNWSPTSERSRQDLERGFHKASSDSPPFTRLNKRYGGSTENLLHPHRRPNHLQLPASSSGDSLDVEVRDREPGYGRSRKSQSMVATKHRIRSPLPAPRMMMPHTPEVGPVAQIIMDGPVKRTKFMEAGKKCRKSWVDSYMVLTTTALIFYKDQKTYYASRVPRPQGTPPSPTAPRVELVLPLKNAHLIQCIQMHTKRFTRSLVLTVGYDQYLIQVDSEDSAKTWLKYIQGVYHKLGLKQDDELGHHQSSNTDLESLGRTPPPARHNRNYHKAGGSSNEDLSDSTEVSIPKSHVKRRLRNFFAKRPTMDSLMKKGIYQEEPVFGRKLEEVCPTTSPRVPEFVVACIREIEGNEENMCTDGLYRASGNLSQVQKIRLEVDQNNLSVVENNTDIHVLTGSLKLFFRELREPLIPCSMFARVLAACSIKPREAKIKEFRDIVSALPPCNRDTLKFLLEHLLRVTQYSERNRMHTANLAIVFGPTLLWAPAEQAHNIAIDCIQQNHVVEILLNDYKDIFDDAKQKKKT